MNIDFTIPEEDLPIFFAYMALGVLRAIQDETVPPQVGIWSLAPLVYTPGAKLSSVPESILSVYQSSDELSSIRRLLPEESYQKTLSELIELLQGELSRLEDPNFHLWWGTSAQQIDFKE